MEWKLFDGPAPEFSTLPFFRSHPWVSPDLQAGHAQRTAMAAGLIRDIAVKYEPASLSDLGCGDGSLLEAIRDLPLRMWGYDAGNDNVAVARAKGRDVRQGDILGPGIEYGELITCCEVLEHLADPHAFLAALPGRLLVITSPSAEVPAWHYEHHAWAWDCAGYGDLAWGAGWKPVWYRDCDGGTNHHGGETRQQRFQAIFATREEGCR